MFQLRVVNAIWGQQDFTFLDTFLQTLVMHYGAQMQTVDFATQAEAARQAINAWIADKTEGRITEVIPPDTFNDLTRLVLVNAIYFKANWLIPFGPNATEDAPFTLLDGSQVQAQMMHASPRVPYFQGDAYQAVSLPYVGQDVAMTLIVPDAGRLGEIEAGLIAGFIDDLRASATVHDVILSMPRFDFKSDLDLGALLPGMGMTAPFSEVKADLSGISQETSLFIAAAMHSATITVDEEGTEAAAVIVVEESSGMEMAELMIDRPFIFAIIERETGAILFLGRVTNPAG